MNLFVLGIAVVFLTAGCGKKKDEESKTTTTTLAGSTTSTVAPTTTTVFTTTSTTTAVPPTTTTSTSTTVAPPVTTTTTSTTTTVPPTTTTTSTTTTSTTTTSTTSTTVPPTTTTTTSTTTTSTTTTSTTTTTIPVPNLPPVIQVSSNVVLSGQSVSLNVSVKDPEGQPVTLVVLQSPSMGSVSGNMTNGFTYTAGSNAEGLETIYFHAEDARGATSDAEYKIEVIKNQAQASFWLKPENIKPASSASSILGDWPDAVTGVSAAFADASQTPKYLANLTKTQKGISLEYSSTSNKTNDYLYYPSTYVFSNTGVSIFVVGLNRGYTSSIAPVVSFGDWITEGWGLSWNAINAGIGSPTRFGGADNKGIATAVTGSLTIFTGIIQTNTVSNNGWQKVKFHNGKWIFGATNMSISALTANQVQANSKPDRGNGSPIMIGANNDASANGDRRFAGDIGEVLIINRALSDEEVAIVETYLKNKFGL